MLSLSPFLKRVLFVDAASCLAMGAAIWPAADLLARPMGLSTTLIGGAGMLLIPVGLFILWLGTRAEAPVALPLVVIGGNLLWAIESLVIAFGDAGVTWLGTLFVAAQGLFVLCLALLEIVGLRQSAKPVGRAEAA